MLTYGPFIEEYNNQLAVRHRRLKASLIRFKSVICHVLEAEYRKHEGAAV